MARAAAPPPGGLPGPGVPPPERCSSCSGPDLTRLPLVLTDGTDVTFVSCNRCERREWITLDDTGAWQSLPIDTIIQRSARKPR
ncbi:hypothetical protein [Actinotalea sp. JY-7885]|uniref:hypothetical protein n=1 Tax=Actinotalea sp. JY-7885 TaxID=2758576 RepID=UPI00165DC2DF|nr:hypothetical protein [Actinotalea sp. JY-7885]